MPGPMNLDSAAGSGCCIWDLGAIVIAPDWVRYLMNPHAVGREGDLRGAYIQLQDIDMLRL